MTKDEALKLALEALESCNWVDDGGYGHAEYDHVSTNKAITAIRETLAQPEQDPVATVESVATVVSESGNQEVTMSWWHEPALPVGTNLYTTPPHRKPLSDEEILHRVDTHVGGPSPSYPLDNSDWLNFARAIEAAHGIWPENSDCHGPDWTDRDGEYLK